MNMASIHALLGQARLSCRRRLVASFGADPGTFATNVEICRILFGFDLLHRFLDIGGYAVIAANPAAHASLSMAGALLALAVMFGALTPFALIALLIGFFVPRPLAASLGSQVSAILTWCLLLAGAGRKWSFDSFFIGRATGRSWRALYALAFELDVTSVAAIRAVSIWAFWGICLAAVSFHIADPLWLRLDLLQPLTRMPYMSEFSYAFRSIAESWPKLFDAFCRIGLLVQGFWEISLFPLMFWAATRTFARWQGLAFFVISLVCLNLGMLAWHELIWWLLVFGVSPLKFSPSGACGKGDDVIKILSRRLPNSIWLAGSMVVGSFVFALVFDQASRSLGARSVLARSLQEMVAVRAWGQGEVNVFNRRDLDMGTRALVLAEVDSEGKFKRLVPYESTTGGRLEYLQNEFLYFTHSLHWHRSFPNQKSVPVGRGSETYGLMWKVALLDACILGGERDRRYKGYVFQRELVNDGPSLGWSESKVVSITPVTVDASSQHGLACDLAFSLPFGHLAQERRRISTEAELRRIEDGLNMGGGEKEPVRSKG